MKPLRVAVVGAGHLGRIHARHIRGLPGLSLAGIVDPVESQRTAVAAEFQAEPFATHTELLGKIDAAVVATPTRFHHQVALDLLAGGVHLLVEKPLATTGREATELVDAARSSRALLQVGHVERFNPVWAKALPHLRDAKYIEAARCSRFMFRSTDIGVVLDLMIHDIDLVLSLVQSPVIHVDAMGISLFGQREDVANARLTFENGCVATLNASRANHQAKRTMQVWTPRGFASLDLATRTGSLVHPSETLLRRELDIETLSPEQTSLLKDRLLEEHLPLEQIEAEPVDAIAAELADFEDSIRSARMPRVSGEQGRDAVVVAEQVIEAIDRHAWSGAADGPMGPLALPATRVIPGPHWGLKTARPAAERRNAG